MKHPKVCLLTSDTPTMDRHFALKRKSNLTLNKLISNAKVAKKPINALHDSSPDADDAFVSFKSNKNAAEVAFTSSLHDSSSSQNLISDIFARTIKKNRSKLAFQASAPLSKKLAEVPLQEALDILKSFDLDVKYGPCIGITRRERWNRAQQLNLDPPVLVDQLLLKYKNDAEMSQSCWNGI
ncbi:DNA polymerase delta subunit 4 [Nowakowskiella sp. JEL0078]|nr:DNA polymerase delta subunit 4 [Nowakowskiella sp. JEL0078]